MTISREDIQNKFTIMPDPQSIVYYSLRVGVADSDDKFSLPYPIENCERRPITMEERQFAGASLEVDSEVWHIWASQLGKIRPKVGDKFSDAEGKWWKVQGGVSAELMRTRYRLICFAMSDQDGVL